MEQVPKDYLEWCFRTFDRKKYGGHRFLFAVIKILFPDPVKAARELAEEYSLKYKNFKVDRFLKWLGEDEEVLRGVIVFGVTEYNQEHRKDEKFQRFVESLD